MKDRRIPAAALALLLWLPPGVNPWAPRTTAFYYMTNCHDEGLVYWDWWWMGCAFMP